MKKHIMRTGIIALAVILLLALMAAAAPRASQEVEVDGVTYEFEILEGNNVSITDINVPDWLRWWIFPGRLHPGRRPTPSPTTIFGITTISTAYLPLRFRIRLQP